MKRSEALNLIANQLNFLYGSFNGFETITDKALLSNANVILTTLEEAGLQPPDRVGVTWEERYEWEEE